MRTKDELIELTPHLMTAEFIRDNAELVRDMLAAMLMIYPDRVALLPVMGRDHLLMGSAAVHWGHDDKNALVILRVEG